MSISTGIPENISGVIDAILMKGADSQIIDDTTYSNNNAVRCNIPNGEILNTGWLPAGTLVGCINFVFYGKSNVSDGTNYIQTYIYRRDKDGNETLQTGGGFWNNPETKTYLDERGLTTGRYTQGFFNINYDYKIVLKTAQDLASGKYVDLDYIQFISTPITPLLYYYNGSADMDIDAGYVFIPAHERVRVTITGNGTSSKTVNFTTKNYYGDSSVYSLKYDNNKEIVNVTDPHGTLNTGTIIFRSTDGATFTGNWYTDLLIVGRALIPTY